MKFVSVIAAGMIAGLMLPPALTYAQDNGVRRGGGGKGEAPAGRPNNPGRPNVPRDTDEGFRAPPMRLVPLNAVVDSIRRSTPGRLLDASGPSGGGRPVYRIRWQADSGQRIDFVVDAQSGAIIGRNGG
jgi:hypothetical protein